MASFQFAQMIVVESSLSFLGLGVRPPTASWGTMINDGRNYIQVAWWLTTIPGFMIMLVVLGANTFGDWLRDRLEPHMRNLN
jgi:peptide/nickel transport system permease protein